MKNKFRNEHQKNMIRLLEEIAEDNTAVIGSLNHLRTAQNTLRTDLVREMGLLRDDFAGALIYRVLKDLCNELIMPLSAMESMLQNADFADTQTIRGHIEGMVITLRCVLSRIGAEIIPIAIGEELFDSSRHYCVGMLTPEVSPFPSTPPRTIVRIVENGYTLAGRVLLPAKVEVQAEKSNGMTN